MRGFRLRPILVVVGCVASLGAARVSGQGAAPESTADKLVGGAPDGKPNALPAGPAMALAAPDRAPQVKGMTSDAPRLAAPVLAAAPIDRPFIRSAVLTHRLAEIQSALEKPVTAAVAPGEPVNHLNAIPSVERLQDVPAPDKLFHQGPVLHAAPEASDVALQKRAG